MTFPAFPKQAVLLGAGMHHFTAAALPRYRSAVLDGRQGAEAFVPFAAKHFAALAPLHRWLRSMKADDE